MVGFEVLVNGRPQRSRDLITTITLTAEEVRSGERVTLHLGAGQDYAAIDDPSVAWLNADLRPGDEITIRIVEVALDDFMSSDAKSCSFCGTDASEIQKLVCGPEVAICDACVQVFRGVVMSGGRLPLGAFIRDAPPWKCGFCGKEPGAVPGVFVRNGAAICPECLRTADDLQD